MEILSMSNISKSFFGVKVLNNVNFRAQKGEVCALLGENGAGKSTLMNILGGVLEKDEGRIIFDGRELSQITVKDSEKAGIAFVHQELNLFNDLLVYENIFLGKEIVRKMGILNKPEMIRQTRQLFDELGVDIDPKEQVLNLPTGKKQLLEIAKALHIKSKLIILDEPTTALNNNEIDHLFSIIRRLKKTGIAFIFISHKMPEVFAISDRFTILRNGDFIKEGLISEIDPHGAAELMVGSALGSEKIYEKRDISGIALRVENLSGDGFSDISLLIRRGEIAAFTGLAGSGAGDLLEAVFAAKKYKSGRIEIEGEAVKNPSIHKAMLKSVAMLPSNRKENSVIADMTLLENEYISEHTLSIFPLQISKKKEVAKYEQYRAKLNVKANSYADPITSLSGGNQQKIIIARLLNTECSILLLDNPTQGIDVGAKEEIYKLILRLSKEGKTVIVHTLEIPEIQKIADRCFVFYQGKVQTVLEREDISEKNVMLYATGLKENRI